MKLDFIAQLTYIGNDKFNLHLHQFPLDVIKSSLQSQAVKMYSFQVKSDKWTVEHRLKITWHKWLSYALIYCLWKARKSGVSQTLNQETTV